MSDEIPACCPECKSRRLIYDSERGEVACQDCGLVISDYGIAAEKSRKRPSTWDYLDVKATKGEKLSSRERTELAVAIRIELLNEKLNLPPMIKNTAIVEGKKLLGYIRKTRHLRLTCEEVAIIAIWIAARKGLFPLSIRELAEASGIGRNKVYPLLNRASKYIILPKQKPPPESYIKRVISKVEKGVKMRPGLKIPDGYLLQLEKEAAGIWEKVRANPVVMQEAKRHSPILFAVAVVHVADENIGGKLTSEKMEADNRRETLLNYLGGGGPSVSALVRFLRLHLGLPSRKEGK